MDLDEAGAQVKCLIRDRDVKFPALIDRIFADAESRSCSPGYGCHA